MFTWIIQKSAQFAGKESNTKNAAGALIGGTWPEEGVRKGARDWGDNLSLPASAGVRLGKVLKLCTEEGL